ncbi:hypothetical protein P154DRAFT_552242 [Amniculicola lignicola CBS 123094]|uniref:TMEM205-like domain-containing protein n=1 Tax=Amniculicola lignicola CBS 123094 TaxID=1392246 RepID=A0A6A5X1H7_9PLEO|nr:hypothetical protein P154DRAFT_552242 [Amniculicola lignicola CBS 123094]
MAVLDSASPLLPSILAPLHLLAYSTLLGAELYQSFVMTKVAHQSLPRSAFTSLQKRLFLIYFQGQSVLLVVVAASVPPYGPASFVQDKSIWTPFAVAGICAGLNLISYGPKTRRLMIERIHQETHDRRNGVSADAVSDGMSSLNRAFSRAHAMSIHLNLITIGATLFYGWKLAAMLKIDSVVFD